MILRWDYRVIHTTAGYGIYEVYYDAEDRPKARTNHPTCIFGETIEYLKEAFEGHLLALEKPVLEDSEYQWDIDALLREGDRTNEAI